MNITIELSQLQASALSYFAEDGVVWATNAVTERCRVATEEIVQLAVQRCLDEGVQVPSTKEEIVALAFAQGWVNTAAERRTAYEAEMAVRQAAAETAQQQNA